MEDVVAGDVVLLEMGDEVPADGRLFKTTELLSRSISDDRRVRTGPQKSPVPRLTKQTGTDQPGCLYRGTQVVDGIGQMLVTEVGDDTALGQIARRLSRTMTDKRSRRTCQDEPRKSSHAQADHLQGTDAACKKS